MSDEIEVRLACLKLVYRPDWEPMCLITRAKELAEFVLDEQKEKRPVGRPKK
jgi:hypothetical protein